MKPRLVYVYDALCGWCFGFSPTVRKVTAELGDSVDLEVVSGGLRLGARVGRLDEVAPYVKTAYRDVERATGVRFGRAFVEGPLARGDLVLDSLPPARALGVVKQQRPAVALAFAAGIHDAIYVEGRAPRDGALYLELAARLGLDVARFEAAFAADASVGLAERDFARASALGVTSFPTLLLETDAGTSPVARGVEPAEVVLERVRARLTHHP